MESPLLVWLSLTGLLAAGVGGLFGFFLRKKILEREAQSAKAGAQAILDEATSKARAIQKEAELTAKDFTIQSKSQFDEETKSRRLELQSQERRIQSKEEGLDRKFDQLERREGELKRLEQTWGDKKKAVDELELKYGGLIEETRKTLEKLAGITAEEARKMLVDQMVADARHEAAKRVKMIEDETRENADQKAKKILGIAVERLAGEWVQEAAISTVKLPSDDLKGRIIGREGRNIRALESLTGVDLIIDETPGAVILSSHNPIRREIARQALEKLLADGRIHPARIEEIMAKVSQDVEKTIREAGQQALFELDLHGVHPELVKLLGSLKYRYSYAQNVLRHSVEVGFLCGMLAAELGLDQKVARRAGLLHDIGKAVSHEVEGSHAVIGGELAKKYGEAPAVVHGIWAHHEDIPQETVLDHLVDAADALSGARPGARMESAEAYIKRLEDLEKIATSFGSVEKAFAIQAGRELRVMVQPEKISDADAVMLCKDIAKRIEGEMTYPGQIKVTVIRETRAIDFAK